MKPNATRQKCRIPACALVPAVNSVPGAGYLSSSAAMIAPDSWLFMVTSFPGRNTGIGQCGMVPS